MKRLLGRLLAFVLAFALAAGTFCAPVPAEAFRDTYYGNGVKVEDYQALSKFTEEGIDYYVTKYASGGQNGQVYVAGCNFRLETIAIPAVVKHGSKYDVIGINDKAFMNYENLTKVTIEDGLTYIGGGAFWGCWYLESITLPKTLKELGDSAFAKCGSLKSITFPESLTAIPNNVCEKSGITKVTFGKKVTSIGSSAFRSCMNLKEVTLPESLKTIESGSFGECRHLGKITNNSKLKKDDYKAAFGSTKWERSEKKADSAFKCAADDLTISLYLDNKKLTKGYLYYRMDDYSSGVEYFDYDDWTLGVYTQLKTDSDGNFVLDKKYIPENTYLIYGKFYYCESKPADFTKDYTFMFGTSDIPSAYESGGEGTTRTVNLYNVRYEPGDEECLFLPEDAVISSRSYYTIGGGLDKFLMGVGRVQSPMAAARALAYFADENGNRIDAIREITKPVTLHPVFVNEDELFTGQNYLAENDYRYSAFKHSSENWSIIVDNVQIKKGTELVKRFLTDYSDKRGYCIIDGKVTVSRTELQTVKDGLDKDDRHYTGIIPENGYIYNSDDVIIVKSGGTLILDGLYLSNGFRISLQKGAKLQLINGAELKYGCTIAVQKGATVEINDSSVSGCIINAGKITTTAPAYKRATDSFYRKSIDSDLFLNCKSGVIDLDYGEMGLGIDSSIDYGPGSLKSDMYDAEDAVAVNNGTINVTGYGHISIEDGYQNREHKEAYAKSPIVNNGTINITSSQKRFFEFAAIEIDHNSFYNYGTIKVTSDVKRSYKRAGSYAAKLAEWEGSFDAEIQVQEAEFINYGTMEFDIKNGVGMSVVESFFPRDRVVKRFEEDGDTASHGRLENRAGGKISITTDNGCGIAIGRNAYLINDGSITIKDKDENSREPSLLIGGRVINNSKISNNGSIGYTSALMGKDLKAYALDNGYSGKKWTGNGRELLGYAIKFSGPEYYEEYNVYVSSGKTVLVDGSFYQGAESSDTVFLPVNSKVRMTVKVSGFTDKTVEYTSAKSVKDYFDTAYKNIKAGTDPINYIKVSLTKGKGTADSSVTRFPMDIGDQIIINNNMYYSVTSADLKGGTVCFEHGSGMHTSLVVPDTITYEGRTYKVTMFEYAGTEVTNVTLGKNIEYINENAFKFSDKLKTIKINSKLLKSGNIEYGAFEKVPASCVITVPKKKVKGYTKIFRAAGLNKKVKIKSK